ncbi:putative lipase atg15, partial [Blyttiomyces sp. JEL0837]
MSDHSDGQQQQESRRPCRRQQQEPFSFSTKNLILIAAIGIYCCSISICEASTNPKSNPNSNKNAFVSSSSTSQNPSSSSSSTSSSKSKHIRLSLRHILRAGFKPSSTSSESIAEGSDSTTMIPFMERLEVTESLASKWTWNLDSDLDLTADAGIRSSSSGYDGDILYQRNRNRHGHRHGSEHGNGNSTSNLPPFGFDFDINAISSQMPMWSTVSSKILSSQTTSATNSKRDPQYQQPLLSDDFWGESDATTTTTKIMVNGKQLLHKDFLFPDETDPATVLALGKMAYNAYYEPSSKEWVEVPGYETSDGFGSQGSAIRGYIFTSQNPIDDVVVIVIKGTSLQTPFTGGPSSSNDKLNDNKMFSCCCGKAGWSWTPVCKCANSAATTCNVRCVEEESDFKESYYRLATSIAHTVQQIFPRSDLWLTGHSLGGALASLVALTFDLPAFTYETPGDLLFAKRLGLLPPVPPGKTVEGLDDWEPYLKTLPIFQFGNDGDPIYLGQCRSVTSSCWYGGYALETKCHVGKECVYDQDADGKTPPPPEDDDDDENEDGGDDPDGDRGVPENGKKRLRRRNRKGDMEMLKSLSIYNHGIQYVID